MGVTPGHLAIVNRQSSITNQASAAAEVERSRWALQRACVEPTPNVTVQAGAAYDYATLDSIALLQVSLPIPIHERNQGAIAEARANIIAAERSALRVELSLQQRLAAVYRQYEQARQQATRYENVILQKAKRNLDLNRSTFEAGERAYLAVPTAQRSRFQARLAWLNALEQLWSARVQMEGLLLNGSLSVCPMISLREIRSAPRLMEFVANV